MRGEGRDRVFSELPDYVEYVRSDRVPDRVHGEHFGHHQQFRRRYKNCVWIYDFVRVPVDRLVCRYKRLGESHTYSGLMEEIERSDLQDLRGRKLSTVIEAVRQYLESHTEVRSDGSVQRIRSLMALGVGRIQELSQTIMVDPTSDPAQMELVEGNHRCIALGLLGEQAIDGVLFNRVRLDEGRR